MRLRWNKVQTEIYDLIQGGLSYKQLKEKGYKKSLIDKVKASIARGDTPQKPLSEPIEPPPGEALFSATLKTKKVTLEPIIAVRHDSVRQALGWGDEYTLEQFLDQSTEIITELVGAVPPGFVREEAKQGVE